ncbi:DNA-3-methyladenine glycosylase [soil metagenome]|nr:DNA-3-methyladenine glycosylase 2 family protein [Gemmatimonadota bacterium]
MSRRPARAAFPEGAVEHLRSADPVLRAVIDRVGDFEPSHEPDLWRALVGSIISQQLSVRAAATIESRVAALAPGDGFPAPEELLARPEETLRACGLSGAKTRYVRDLAAKWTDGSLAIERLPIMDDETVITELTQVKGIGRWTAEMVLIFTLGRMDVLPVDDLGTRSAVQRAYGLDERPGAADLRALGEAWRPFRSVATLYLWRSLNG